MEKKEILFCDLTVLKNKKEIQLTGCVILENETHYKKMEIKKKTVLKSLGFQTIPSGFTEVTKSDEKRNTTTGAYD